MEFLKDILGEDLYKQVETKLNEHNGNEANKDNLIKLANLAKGDYVDKNKYSSLETEKNSKIAELEQANNLIAELKKGTKGNEELQGKVATYEGEIAKLQGQLAQEKLNNAVKVNLLSAKATDVEYLTYQLMKQGELKLDEKGEISSWNDKLTTLKTQYPNFFEASQNKVYDDGKLPKSDGNPAPTPTTLSGALQQKYEQK